MKVLLIAANTERINMFTLPLGLGLVAAATRGAGHDVAFLDLLQAGDPLAAVAEAVRRKSPDVIGISVRNVDDQNRAAPRLLLEQGRQVVDACRACSEAPIVVGGPGYCIFPAEALVALGADFGVWGDGEEAFVALLDRLEGGGDPRSVPGVLVRGDPLPAERAFARGYADAPLWDDALTEGLDPGDPELWLPIQARRGCPNDCSYCSTSRIQGRHIRVRPAHRVAERVGRLTEQGFRRFFFVDNSFNIPRPYALELCRELGAVEPRVAWRCILYPELVDEELVSAMAAGGCVHVSLGFESGAPGVLREMNKRYSPADVRRTSDLLRAHGIRRMGFLLLGGPGETRETVEQSLAFAESLDLDGLLVTPGIRIYPGTALARRAVAEGIIDEHDDLLRPRFYVAPGLESWLDQRLGR